VVRIGGARAFYLPSTDHIQLPPDFAFNGPDEFAATALHELAHWTGRPSRLNRDLQNRYGSSACAMEEARAAPASAFAANEPGIPTDIPHHASDIASRIKPLRDDRPEIFRAGRGLKSLPSIGARAVCAALYFPQEFPARFRCRAHEGRGEMTQAQKAAIYDQLVQLLHDRIELEKHYRQKNMGAVATFDTIEAVRTDAYKAVVELILGSDVLRQLSRDSP